MEVYMVVRRVGDRYEFANEENETSVVYLILFARYICGIVEIFNFVG